MFNAPPETKISKMRNPSESLINSKAVPKPRTDNPWSPVRIATIETIHDKRRSAKQLHPTNEHQAMPNVLDLRERSGFTRPYPVSMQFTNQGRKMEEAIRV
jgi:hypothetical protein|tara:strand:- start:15 stop:317 length:303 start_codon:yes stop_codon:yes gene_type:complete